MFSRIILIGMPGSGKSTLGRQLADELNLDFFDLDELIEKDTSLSISEIFENYGEAHFRDLESETLKKFLETKANFVLAAGGGTPCFQDNMIKMNERATTIFLDVSINELVERLVSTQNNNRPLLKSGDLEFKIKNTLAERKVFYEKSKYKISGNSIKLADLIALLKKESNSKGN